MPLLIEVQSESALAGLNLKIENQCDLERKSHIEPTSSIAKLSGIHGKREQFGNVVKDAEKIHAIFEKSSDKN